MSMGTEVRAMMLMNGLPLGSMEDFLKNFSIEDLIWSFYTGELTIFLRKIGETEKADSVEGLKRNAYMLEKLYRVFGIDPSLTEEEVREQHS